MRDYAQHEKVLSAFLLNYKMTDIIRESGLSRSTVYKLRHDVDFQKALAERKHEILKTATAKLQSYTTSAAETLIEIIGNPENSAQIRLNAINILFSQLGNLTAISDLWDVVSELEERNDTF